MSYRMYAWSLIGVIVLIACWVLSTILPLSSAQTPISNVPVCTSSEVVTVTDSGVVCISVKTVIKSLFNCSPGQILRHSSSGYLRCADNSTTIPAGDGVLGDTTQKADLTCRGNQVLTATRGGIECRNIGNILHVLFPCSPGDVLKRNVEGHLRCAGYTELAPSGNAVIGANLPSNSDGTCAAHEALTITKGGLACTNLGAILEAAFALCPANINVAIGYDTNGDLACISTRGSCPAESGATTQGCTLPLSPHATTAGQCSGNTIGTCSYTCNDGSWEKNSNLCRVARSCSNDTVDNCDVTGSQHGSSSGTCKSGYINQCQYQCNDGTWEKASNTCTPAPINGGWTDWSPPASTVCDPAKSLDPAAPTTVAQTRTCTNPAPAHGGRSCSGASSRTVQGTKDCTCKYSGWSGWSGNPSTSSYCTGKSFSQTVTRTRTKISGSSTCDDLRETSTRTATGAKSCWCSDGINVSWSSDSGATCSGYTPRTTVNAYGGVFDRIQPHTGSAAFRCNAGQTTGEWNNTPYGGTCAGTTAVIPPPVRIDGKCGATVNSCRPTAGTTLRNTPDTATNNLWQCVGSGGGTTADCSLPKECEFSTPWTPAAFTVCSGKSFTQTRTRTSGPANICPDTQSATGTKSCRCAGTWRRWEKGGNACSGSLTATPAGSTATARDTTKPVTGAATYSCVAGQTSATFNTSPTTSSCRVDACEYTDFTWTPSPATVCTGQDVPQTGTRTRTAGPAATCKDTRDTRNILKGTKSCRINARCGATVNSCRPTAGTTLRNTPDTFEYSLWQCVGSGGGTNANCSLPRPCKYSRWSGWTPSPATVCSRKSFTQTRTRTRTTGPAATCDDLRETKSATGTMDCRCATTVIDNYRLPESPNGTVVTGDRCIAGYFGDGTYTCTEKVWGGRNECIRSCPILTTNHCYGTNVYKKHATDCERTLVKRCPNGCNNATNDCKPAPPTCPAGKSLRTFGTCSAKHQCGGAKGNRQSCTPSLGGSCRFKQRVHRFKLGINIGCKDRWHTCAKYCARPGDCYYSGSLYASGQSVSEYCTPVGAGKGESGGGTVTYTCSNGRFRTSGCRGSGGGGDDGGSGHGGQ